MPVKRRYPGTKKRRTCARYTLKFREPEERGAVNPRIGQLIASRLLHLYVLIASWNELSSKSDG
jgi:hypothetical protein